MEFRDYKQENGPYQEALDRVYGAGTVTPLEKFINGEAILLHHCSHCKHEFYGKPKWLVDKESQKHLCSMPYGDSYGNRMMIVNNRGESKRKKAKRLTETQKQSIIQLAKQGVRIGRIARELDIATGSVVYYIRKAGLEERLG